MSGIIKLEDGSDIYASNLGLRGALMRIGEAISGTDARLSRWLLDVSRRTAPFMDFDLRELSPESRSAFWLGVERAHEKAAQWNQEESYSWCVEVVLEFYKRRAARETLYPAQLPLIDLDEIWFDDE